MAVTTTSGLGLTVLAAMMAMTACTTTPTAPSVLVLPAAGRTHDEFLADDARCRTAGNGEVQRTTGGYVSPQARYDMVYVQCMYAAGHQVPVRGGTPMQSREAPASSGAPASTPSTPPPPASTPPPPPPTTR